MDKNIKEGRKLCDQAEKLVNNKSWFSKPDYRGAIDLYQRAVTEYKRAANYDDAADVMGILGGVYVLKKDLFSAGKAYEDSAVARLENLRRRYAHHENPAQHAKVVLRERLAAQEAYRKSAEAYRGDETSWDRVAGALLTGGKILANAEAVAMLEEAYGLYSKQDQSHEAVEALRHAVKACIALKDFPRALQCLEKMGLECQPNEGSARNKQVGAIAKIPLCMIAVHLYLKDSAAAFEALNEYEDIIEDFDGQGYRTACYHLLNAYHSGDQTEFSRACESDPNVLMLDKEFIDLLRSVVVPKVDEREVADLL